MSKKYYPEVNPNPNFPEIEQEILEFWKENKIFKQSVEKNTGDEFVFYDGPPFANGLPHYGHLLTGFVKDAFARYQTMQGKRVERRFGWDCHGLPAEMGSEKELGISGRQAIQNFGIDKFNEHCRTNVMKYADEWEDYVTRQARFVDFKNDYKTMDINFMESVLWAFKQLYDKGLIFEAHRVMPYSWAAETPLSNFETKLDNSYREREDKAVTVAFELNEKPVGAPDADKYYILAWTTTPWTLPSNLALGVNPKIEYYCARVMENDGLKHCYIYSKSQKDTYDSIIEKRSKNYNSNGLEEQKTLLEIGSLKDTSALIGLTYKPLFPYFADRAAVIPTERSDEGSLQSNNNNDEIPHKDVRDDRRAFRILDGSSFVTDGDGTGIVHLAPAFGEEDQKCCEKNGIELVCPVDGQGKFTDEIFDIPSTCHPREGGNDTLRLKGLNVIAEAGGSKFGLVNDRIIEYLKNTGKLIKQEQIKHNYPHCWRTDTPLIYRAMPSWYVEVTKFRERAAELNQQINWIPEHIRDGQMGHMLKTAPDWSISRNRFWGTPIPVWRKEGVSGFGIRDSEIKVFGSIAELEEFFDLEACQAENPNHESRIPNPRITDLHRPFIDTLTIAKDGSRWRRVEDVFDCWFESGSMPFAQVHYPFENKDWFEEHFPADFITEYVGQTRGWFNTLIMLSTALFDKIPFKNCICHGVVLDAETGLKYSKRLKNYKDPLETINQFGADALRWLMLASPVMRGQDLMVDPEGKFIRDVVRLAIKPIWNAYNFFTLYANADGVSASSCEPSGCTASPSADPALSLRSPQDDRNIMDAYILAKCNQAVLEIKKAFDNYDTPSACEAVLQFFDALNNWYIRRNKERFWKSEHDADKQAAYDTLYTVLTTMCRAAAPLLPLTCEEIYRGLTRPSPRPLPKGEGEEGEALPRGEEFLTSPSPFGRGRGEGVTTTFNPQTDEELLSNARELRANSTDAEKLIWYKLRDRQIAGAKFKRQFPIGNYIADFCCHEAKLIIELDGGQHAEQQNYDQKRTDFLETQGYKVMRFWNNEVLQNTDGVLQVVYEYLTSVLGERPSPRPLPKGEGEESISVHLAEFPKAVISVGDNELIADMDTVQEICNAILAIRNREKIRVRQPLNKVIISSGSKLELKYLQDLIADEGNIKDIIINQSPKDYVNNDKIVIKPSGLKKRFIPLGKEKKIGEIIAKSKRNGDFRIISDDAVEIAGEHIYRSKGEWRWGWISLPDNIFPFESIMQKNGEDIIVVLDTTITPELEAEGIARDIVRMIQQARKDANLDVSDKINLYLEADAKIMAAILAHQAYIMEQTLTSELLKIVPTTPIYSTENELDNTKITIAFFVAN